MGNAISICFSKYAKFNGRASRSEYWYFYLFYMFVYFLGAIVGNSAGSQAIQYVVILPLIIPMLSVTIRRIHDTGRSGWFILVPVYNFILMFMQGTPGPNQYGVE